MGNRIYKTAKAGVRIFGPTLDPLQVSLALRLPADHTHRAGEPRLSRGKKGKVCEAAPYRHGMWSMSSEGWVDSPVLATHITWLLEQLEPKAAALAALLTDDIKADIFCHSVGANPFPPSLPAKLRDRAVVLGLTIGIDHYDSTGEEQ